MGPCDVEELNSEDSSGRTKSKRSGSSWKIAVETLASPFWSPWFGLLRGRPPPNCVTRMPPGPPILKTNCGPVSKPIMVENK